MRRGVKMRRMAKLKFISKQKQMNKCVVTIHTALTVLAWAIFAAEMIFVAVIWNEIPDEVGRHFAANGEFDLYGSKTIAFYHPFIANLLLLLLFEACDIAAFCVKPSERIDSRGNELRLSAVVLTTDVLKLSSSCFFLYWTYLVARQTRMNAVYGRLLLVCWLVSLTAAVVICVSAGIKHKIKSEKEKRHDND